VSTSDCLSTGSKRSPCSSNCENGVDAAISADRSCGYGLGMALVSACRLCKQVEDTRSSGWLRVGCRVTLEKGSSGNGDFCEGVVNGCKDFSGTPLSVSRNDGDPVSLDLGVEGDMGKVRPLRRSAQNTQSQKRQPKELSHNQEYKQVRWHTRALRLVCVEPKAV
jgi:hypothetical protein